MVSINKLQNEFSYSFNEIGIILNLSSFYTSTIFMALIIRLLFCILLIAWNKFFSMPLTIINCLAKNHVP